MGVVHPHISPLRDVPRTADTLGPVTVLHEVLTTPEQLAAERKRKKVTDYPHARQLPVRYLVLHEEPHLVIDHLDALRNEYHVVPILPVLAKELHPREPVAVCPVATVEYKPITDTRLGRVSNTPL